MTQAGPTFRPPHAVTAAPSPLPEEPARRPSSRARTGEPFPARIAQCVPRADSVVTVVSGILLLQLVAAQGVAAIMPDRPGDAA